MSTAQAVIVGFLLILAAVLFESLSPGEPIDERTAAMQTRPSYTKPERRKFMNTIQIKYHTDIPKLHNVGGAKSDWIDMYAAEDVKMKAGESKLISLGVSMKLPEGYEAHLVPRSSTFKKWGIIQTNHMGVIDNAYSGDNDVWMMPVYAVRDTEIKFGDRICQFRLMKKMDEVSFEEVDHLDEEDRGGFGSTGS